MPNLLSALLGVTIISAIPLLGLLVLLVSKKKIDGYLHLLVGFAIGALLGNSIIHILPEVFASSSNATASSLYVILGILVFYSLEQFLQWHHSHEIQKEEGKFHLALLSMIGDTVHNFLDGLLIAGSFLVSPHLGWVTVIAVILHEIPQEIADFGVLYYAKWPISKIIWVNLLSAAAAFVGIFVGYLTNSTLPGFAQVSLAMTAGGFIYIACTDLIPDLHDHGASSMKERMLQLGTIALGIFLFVVI